MRTIELLRARVKIGMMNPVYNMMRLGQWLRRDGSDGTGELRLLWREMAETIKE